MLKKVFLILLTLALVGCSAGTVSTEEVSAEFQRDFSCKVAAACGGDETEMECERSGGSLSFKITSPEELAGLEIEIEGDKMTAEFEEMKTEINFSALPKGGALRLFKRLVETLALPDEYEVSQRGGEIIAVGKDFSASLEPGSFGLLSARFPDENTEFTFSDWAFFEEK